MIEYAKRVGFSTCLYVKIASPKQYIKELNKYLEIDKGLIDVKKETKFERGSRSKLLVIYIIELKVKEIDKLLYLLKSP